MPAACVSNAAVGAHPPNRDQLTAVYICPGCFNFNIARQYEPEAYYEHPRDHDDTTNIPWAPGRVQWTPTYLRLS